MPGCERAGASHDCGAGPPLLAYSVELSGENFLPGKAIKIGVFTPLFRTNEGVGGRNKSGQDGKRRGTSPRGTIMVRGIMSLAQRRLFGRTPAMREALLLAGDKFEQRRASVLGGGAGAEEGLADLGGFSAPPAPPAEIARDIRVI